MTDRFGIREILDLLAELKASQPTGETYRVSYNEDLLYFGVREDKLNFLISILEWSLAEECLTPEMLKDAGVK